MNDDSVYKMVFNMQVEIAEKKNEIIMQTIQEIGGEKFYEVTIDRNKVIEALTMYQNKADFVEVVRCEECEYGELDDPALPNQRFCKYNGCDWNNENHFCSYGERKSVTDTNVGSK